MTFAFKASQQTTLKSIHKDRLFWRKVYALHTKYYHDLNEYATNLTNYDQRKKAFLILTLLESSPSSPLEVPANLPLLHAMEKQIEIWLSK
mmetsp:Transcript_13938/g.17518  ORF Transcript_13938/g.17518 Transcript_13938/m.17518 type:complete len:91 (+) Transcript_13938:78-350(+)